MIIPITFMITAFLKDELTKAIEGINDESLLEALYTIINKAKLAEQSEFEISEYEWKIIEDRQKAFKAGEAETITINEIRKRLNKKFAS